MDTVLIAIPLPDHVKSLLGRLCYGIPEAKWIEEENFHLPLKVLNNIDGALLLDIKEALKQVIHPSFTISFKGLRLSSQKKSLSKTTLYATISPSTELQTLKRHIDHALSELKLPPDKQTSQSDAMLAKLENPKSIHLYDFLASNSDFQTPSFPIDHFCLFTIQRSTKRTIYSTEATYFLSKFND